MNILEQLSAVRLGIVFSLLTLIFGFGLGGVFGAFEDNIKDHLKEKAEKGVDSFFGFPA